MDQQMYNELVHGILSVLSDRALKIVLYGSAARGTETPESDIDIAVFVNSGIDSEIEDRLSEMIMDLNLKYNKVFSVIDIDDATYRKWKGVTPFYQNVDREGIVLWKAA